MIDPLEFLDVTHRQAEEEARYTENGILFFDTADQHVADHYHHAGSPAAVLRRIARERELLAEHQPEREAYIYPDVDEPGVLTAACKTCAQGQNYELRPEIYPCPTVRLLAEAWGWTSD